MSMRNKFENNNENNTGNYESQFSKYTKNKMKQTRKGSKT